MLKYSANWGCSMNKLEFATKEEFKLYLKKNIVKQIGAGAEGICYLLKDGSALKVYGCPESDYEPCSYSIIDYMNPEDIIMSDEVEIENFLFPEKLVFVNGKVRAYKTKYIPNDTFGLYLYPENVDFEKLVSAYYDFLNQVIAISKKNIVFYDLAYNLIFNNEKLYAIDTIEYEKKENVLEENIKSLKYAISMAMSLIIKRASIMAEEDEAAEEEIIMLDEETIEEYLVRVRTKLDKYLPSYQFRKE